jgi:hypothetical protein
MFKFPCVSQCPKPVLVIDLFRMKAAKKAFSHLKHSHCAGVVALCDVDVAEVCTEVRPRLHKPRGPFSSQYLLLFVMSLSWQMVVLHQEIEMQRSVVAHTF